MSQVIYPRIDASVGRSISSLTYESGINRYGVCTVDYHTSEGAVMAQSEAFLQRRAQFRAAIANPTSANFTATVSGIGDPWNFSGFLSTAGGTNAVGDLRRPASAVHVEAGLSHLRSAVYTVPTDILQGRAEFVAGTLAERLITLTKAMVEEGTRRLDESASPLAEGLKKAAQANAKPLEIWYSLLNASIETIGYDELASLAGTSQIDLFINSFLYNQLMSARSDFFQVILGLTAAFGLYYQPAHLNEPARLCSPVKMLQNPREIPMSYVMASFSDGVPNTLVPTGVLISGLPFAITENSGKLRYGAIGLGDPCGVVYPQDASGYLVEVGCPAWMPSSFLPADDAVNVQSGGQVRFGRSYEEKVQIMTDETSAYIEELSKVVNEYARISWLVARTAAATASFSGPLDFSIRAGEALRISLGQGGSITGIVQSVVHTAYAISKAPCATNFSLSYLQD